MTTTINQKVKGSVMEQIFDKAEKFSVRYFDAKNVSEKDYNPEQEYEYEIVIRHPEGTSAKRLFNSAIKLYS